VRDLSKQVIGRFGHESQLQGYEEEEFYDEEHYE